MRRAGALVALLVGLTVLTGPARAQIPPLPLPTTTTTTTTSPPEDALPEDTLPEDTAPPTTGTTLPMELPPAPVDLGGVPVTTIPSSSTTLPPRPPVRKVLALPLSEVDLAGSFGVGVGGVLLIALLLVSLASRARPGGLRMSDPRRRWRLLTAVGSLALAAVVGFVGWLKLSLEPQVNHQLPYLASAGMALVLLAAVGGSLLVAEQLRSDDQRIADLEDAVRRLATTLEPIVESPARRK